MPIHATISSVLWTAHPVVISHQSPTGPPPPPPPRRCPFEPLTSFPFHVLDVLSVNCNQSPATLNSQPTTPHPRHPPHSLPPPHPPRKPGDRAGRSPHSRFQHHGQLPAQIVCFVRTTDSSLAPLPDHPGCTTGQGGPHLGSLSPSHRPSSFTSKSAA